jgi:hypothetical protein
VSENREINSSSIKFPITEPLGRRTVNLSVDQRYHLLQSIWRHEHLEHHRRVAERFGWEAADELIGEYGKDHTDGLVETYSRVLGLDGEGAAAVSQVFQAEIQCEGGDVEVIEESPERAEVSALCGMGYLLQRPRYQGMPITDGLCETGCRLWLQKMSRAVDPDLVVERTSWMPAGDSRCTYRIHRPTTTG